MSPFTPSTVAEKHGKEDLKQIVREFEAATGINIRGWVRRPTPTAEYVDADSLVCQRCGLRQKGQHRNWLECLLTYRELVARQQLRIEQLEADLRRKERAAARFLTLYGERMCLSEAAQALDITPKALRNRLTRWLGKNWEETGEIDLVAIGIDKRYARRKRPGKDG